MTNRSGLPRAGSVQGRGQCYKCIERRGEEGREDGDGTDLSIADIPSAAFRRDDRLSARSICVEAVREREMDGPEHEIY